MTPAARMRTLLLLYDVLPFGAALVLRAAVVLRLGRLNWTLLLQFLPSEAAVRQRPTLAAELLLVPIEEDE